MAGYKRSGARAGPGGPRRGAEPPRPVRSATETRYETRDDDLDEDRGRARSRGPEAAYRTYRVRTPRREMEEPVAEGRLAELGAEFFSLAIELRRGGDMPEAATLQRTLTQQFDELKARASEVGIPASDVEQAKYALAAFLDETVLHSSSPGKEAWVAQPLQMQYFNENTAGEGFFTRLEQLRRSRSRDLLEVYYLCLALGFEGKYRMAAGGELAALREDLARELAPRAKSSRRLSPHGGRPDAAEGEGRRFPLWLVGAGVAILVVLVLVVAGRSVGSDARQLGERLLERAKDRP